MKIQPLLLFSLRPLGKLLQETGRNVEAILVLEKVLELHAEDSDSWFWLGRALGEEGRSEESKKALLTAIQLKFKDPEQLAQVMEQFKDLL